MHVVERGAFVILAAKKPSFCMCMFSSHLCLENLEGPLNTLVFFLSCFSTHGDLLKMRSLVQNFAFICLCSLHVSLDWQKWAAQKIPGVAGNLGSLISCVIGSIDQSRTPGRTCPFCFELCPCFATAPDTLSVTPIVQCIYYVLERFLVFIMYVCHGSRYISLCPLCCVHASSVSN